VFAIGVASISQLLTFVGVIEGVGVVVLVGVIV